MSEMTAHKARSVLLSRYGCLKEIKLFGCDGHCKECEYYRDIDETIEAYETAISLLEAQPPANAEEAVEIELEKRIRESVDHDLLYGDFGKPK